MEKRGTTNDHVYGYGGAKMKKRKCPTRYNNLCGRRGSIGHTQARTDIKCLSGRDFIRLLLHTVHDSDESVESVGTR